MAEHETGLALNEFDPSAPEPGDDVFEHAVEAANQGLDGRGDLPPGEDNFDGLEAPDGALPVMDIDIDNAKGFLRACMTSNPRVKYGLGAKIKFGQIPGQDFTAVDCSGFVREAIGRSTSLSNKFPDGSVVQHDWIKSKGFERVDRASAQNRDGAVRIAFLRPSDAPSGIGHVVWATTATRSSPTAASDPT